MAGIGATNYGFNSFAEIRSHSSILFNERLAILFYLLDMKNLVMYRLKTIDSIYEVHAVLRQIYKNIRMLIRYNDTIRVSLHLETKDPGIYTLDIAISMINNMLRYCEENGYTEKRIHILMQEMDNAEMMIKDILQYYSYFVRPDFRQKPDIEIATERYKEIADAKTVEELREIVGKRHSVDFASLGTERIEIQNNKLEYDPIIDGDIDEYKDEEENIDMEEDEDEGLSKYYEPEESDILDVE